MSDDPGVSEDTNETSRWTCEACGCNTNSEDDNPLSCGVCGTRRAPGLFLHGGSRLGLIRGFSPDDEDDEELDDENIDENEERISRRLNNRESSDADAAALLMVGASGEVVPFRGGRGARRLFRGAAPPELGSLLRLGAPGPRFSSSRSGNNRSTLPATSPDPEQLLTYANNNADQYNPKWSTRYKGSSIQVDEESHPNIAYLSEGGDEGRCVRATEAIPFAPPFRDSLGGGSGSSRLTTRALAAAVSNNEENSASRNVFGWKIVFEHFSRDAGKSIGGCYLAGVTTQAFTGFSDRSGLQQSRYFWGIEDGGRRYEGNMNRNRPSGSGSGSYGVQLGRSEAPRNSDNVLFGSREVITIVADMNSRTLTYWRDDRLLGTLVTSLPRGTSIYPVAVPFNVGVSVAITGMNGEPLDCLSDFQAATKLAREQKNNMKRSALAEQKAQIIKDGKLTSKLIETLRKIFSMYSDDSVVDTACLNQIKLNSISASRLWYRCGISLSHLHSLLEPAPATMSLGEENTSEKKTRKFVTADDFINLITKVVEDEELVSKSKPESKMSVDPNDSISAFGVGDKVEVVEHYERYSDASSGPLRPGDRGTIMEIQRGPRGDRHSVRVVFNGRRWWYHPDALLSERSGLVESPTVRFVKNILRSHGYDMNMEQIWGKQITSESYELGDLVASSSIHSSSSSSNSNSMFPKTTKNYMLGRIVSTSSSQKEHSMVSVDFSNAKNLSRRVPISSLFHTTFHQGTNVLEKDDDIESDDSSSDQQQDEETFFFSRIPQKEKKGNDGKDDDSDSDDSSCSKSKNQSKHIMGVSELEKSSITNVMKECKSVASLARMFSEGLSDAIITGIDLALEGERDPSCISAIGSLVVTVTRQLFREEDSPAFCEDTGSNENENNEEKNEETNTVESSQRSENFNPRGASNSSVNVRDLIRDLGVGPEQRRAVILALMAGGRPSDEGSILSDTSLFAREYGGIRGRQLASSFGQLSAEAMSYRHHSSSFQQMGSDDENDASASSVLSGTSNATSLNHAHAESFIQSISRGGKSSLFLSHARRTINPTTKKIIHDGLLLNNINWVEKILKSDQTAATAFDEDDTSVLNLAITLGCNKEVVKALINSGASIKVDDLKRAAYTNQPEILSLLLEDAIYIEGTIDLERCSDIIIQALNDALANQKKQEKAMRDAAKSFSCTILQKFMALAFKYRNEQAKSSSFILDALCGDTLLYAVYISQFRRIDSANREKHAVDSNRSFTVFPEFLPRKDDTSCKGLGGKCNFIPSGGFTSILDNLPPSIIQSALSSCADDVEKSSSITTYLCLSESYLWSRDKKDIAVGLALVYTLLKKVPEMCGEMIRYGFKDLSASHVALASERILDIISKNPSLKSQKVESNECIVVKCPKGHKTSLHLTRHSQFKCDLCGEGIEQNKAMHGCRECDWDACETCTEKAEGGVIKWTFIKDIGIKCQQIFEKIEADGTTITTDNQLLKSCSLINSRKLPGINDLNTMLNIPGKVTLFEFGTYVLPPLHRAFIHESNSTHGQNQINNESRKRVPTRRNKKPRVGRWKNSHSKSSNAAGTCESCDDNSFVSSALKTLLSPSEGKRHLQYMSNIKPKSRKEENHGQTLARIILSESGQIREVEMDVSPSDQMQEGFRDNDVIRPIVVDYLHSLLGFYESVTVNKVSSPTSSSDSKKTGGALQSLVLPFEITLERSSVPTNVIKSSGSIVQPFSDLNGAVVHIEPLMSISQLQRHILRCVKIHIPAYIDYCKKLVSNKAIIVEKNNDYDFKDQSDTDESENYSSYKSRRIGQVVGYDEFSGAHRIRYASHLMAQYPEDDDILFSHSSIVNELEFNGKEIMVVLAARDYSILYRMQRRDDLENTFEIDKGNENASQLEIDSSSSMDIDSLPCNVPLSADTTNIRENSVLNEVFVLPNGLRVESDVNSSDNLNFEVFTIHSSSLDETSSNNTREPLYNLVSDSGEVFLKVSGSNVRGHDALLKERGITYLQQRKLLGEYQTQEGKGDIDMAHPLSFEQPSHTSRQTRHSNNYSSEMENTPATPAVGVLKRTWSALSPLQNMNALDLNFDEERSLRGRTRKLSISKNEVEINLDWDTLEKPPELDVGISMDQTHPPLAFKNAADVTLFSALHQLLSREKRSKNKNTNLLERRCKVFYSITMKGKKGNIACWQQDSSTSNKMALSPLTEKYETNDTEALLKSPPFFTAGVLYNRNQNINEAFSENEIDASLHTVVGSEAVKDLQLKQCEGLDETCIQCLELLNFLAEGSNYGKAAESNSYNINNVFVSQALTTKLLDQLDDPLTVVSGAMPYWCRTAPSLAPRVFSHDSRRRLLERGAFGVSRSTFRQQEAKVAVGPLRQKMAALRGRAVELVGEAFSGGAADPTALQLQADELYGMEDALANRITAAFRAQRWDEHFLQCAKAVIRRDHLLRDAAAVLRHYSRDIKVNRRRLEVRFEGESGFDAAAGDEAGVTRGFYADVAEALLSCDHVSGVYQADTTCPVEFVSEVDKNTHPQHASLGASPLSIRSKSKLPLWIPDVDTSGKVIIPTPRANPKSLLGVFPRPITPNNPMYIHVLEQFRFMGRLFAAALRDGFTFPIPLSPSFLELIQVGSNRALENALPLESPLKGRRCPSSNSFGSSDYPSNNSNISTSSTSSPVTKTNMSIDEFAFGESNSMDTNIMRGQNEILMTVEHSNFSNHSNDSVQTNLDGTSSTASYQLNSNDLPRPGFLGGEIYAVEQCICRELDLLDEMDISGDELARKRKAISSDKNFARTALGKSYDCSFEQYFEDKTFVDPLDPSQGEGAAPLCRDGASIAVTIDNIREWVNLSKRFFLYDGIIAQAVAFRLGINDFFSVGALRLFTAEELYRDVCGGGDGVENWDEDAIRALFKLDGGKGAAEARVAVAAMGGEGGAALSRRFGPSSPTVGYLIKTLLEANTTERRQFLSFVTSVPIVTPGLIEVVPVVNPAGEFLAVSEIGLPRSNTCARRLYLPKFENYEEFSKVLWSVIKEESRFKGFFEWRG